MQRTLRFLGAALVAVPAMAAAQKPYVLSAKEMEYGEPFTSITGLRELGDGRVIVADARDKTVQMVNLKAGSSTKIGREGSGPGEYNLPLRLYGFPSDTSVVFDAGNQRYLTILPDGKTGKDFRLETPPPAASGRGNGPRISLGGLAIPRGADARGNIYFEGQAFAIGEDGAPKAADSIPILRYVRATGKTDTVAYSHPAKNTAQVSGSAGNVRMQIGGANPLVPRDDWAVLPDGRVAVVRAADYHVDVYGPRKVAGPPAPYEKIRVDAAVKQMVEDARQKARSNSISMTVNSGPGGVQRSTSMGGNNLPPLQPLTDWPDMMPPFLAQGTLTGGGVVARPNGELWVAVAQRPGFKSLMYDVFDGSGKVIGRVALPPDTRLVGFGNGAVYLVRIDADDLQYLQRYRLPNDVKLNG
jgi:hypothetical protein